MRDLTQAMLETIIWHWFSFSREGFTVYPWLFWNSGFCLPLPLEHWIEGVSDHPKPKRQFCFSLPFWTSDAAWDNPVNSALWLKWHSMMTVSEWMFISEPESKRKGKMARAPTVPFKGTSAVTPHIPFEGTFTGPMTSYKASFPKGPHHFLIVSLWDPNLWHRGNLGTLPIFKPWSSLEDIVCFSLPDFLLGFKS